MLGRVKGWLAKEDDRGTSRADRLKKAALSRLRKHRDHPAKLSPRFFPDGAQALSPDGTYGLLRFTVHGAQLQEASPGAKYFVVVSVGSQSLVTGTARVPGDHERRRRDADSRTHGSLPEGGCSAAQGRGALTYEGTAVGLGGELVFDAPYAFAGFADDGPGGGESDAAWGGGESGGDGSGDDSEAERGDGDSRACSEGSDLDDEGVAAPRREARGSPSGEEGDAGPPDEEAKPGAAAAAATAPDAAGARPANAAAAASPRAARLSWDQSARFILHRGGAVVARVALYRSGRYRGVLSSRLVAWCAVDLSRVFADGGEGADVADLADGLVEGGSEEGGDGDRTHSAALLEREFISAVAEHGDSWRGTPPRDFAGHVAGHGLGLDEEAEWVAEAPLSPAPGLSSRPPLQPGGSPLRPPPTLPGTPTPPAGGLSPVSPRVRRPSSPPCTTVRREVSEGTQQRAVGAAEAELDLALELRELGLDGAGAGDGAHEEAGAVGDASDVGARGGRGGASAPEASWPGAGGHAAFRRVSSSTASEPSETSEAHGSPGEGSPRQASPRTSPPRPDVPGTASPEPLGEILTSGWADLRPPLGAAPGDGWCGAEGSAHADEAGEGSPPPSAGAPAGAGLPPARAEAAGPSSTGSARHGPAREGGSATSATPGGAARSETSRGGTPRDPRVLWRDQRRVEAAYRLVDPTDPSKTLGSVSLSATATSMQDLPTRMWRHLLALSDHDGDGWVREGEVAALLDACGVSALDVRDGDGREPPPGRGSPGPPAGSGAAEGAHLGAAGARGREGGGGAPAPELADASPGRAGRAAETAAGGPSGRPAEPPSPPSRHGNRHHAKHDRGAEERRKDLWELLARRTLWERLVLEVGPEALEHGPRSRGAGAGAERDDAGAPGRRGRPDAGGPADGGRSGASEEPGERAPALAAPAASRPPASELLEGSRHGSPSSPRGDGRKSLFRLRLPGRHRRHASDGALTTLGHGPGGERGSGGRRGDGGAEGGVEAAQGAASDSAGAPPPACLLARGRPWPSLPGLSVLHLPVRRLAEVLARWPGPGGEGDETPGAVGRGWGQGARPPGGGGASPSPPPALDLLRTCPVDGSPLGHLPPSSRVLYVCLALSEAASPPNTRPMRGGYASAAHASRAWGSKAAEWVGHTVAGDPRALLRGNRNSAGGLRRGAAAAHILVFDRRRRMVVEERVPALFSLAMRNMYQSSLGAALLRQGYFERLTRMSEAKGRYMDSPESVREIAPFVATFSHEIDLGDVLLPLDRFATFNEFFARELRPGARPIDSQDDPRVLTSAADCRLMCYESVTEATRFWIKGRAFSVAGLLGRPAGGARRAAGTGRRRAAAPAPSNANAPASPPGGDSGSEDVDGGEGEGGGAGGAVPAPSYYHDGSLAIFRLAPQDYHRFHSPVTGRIVHRHVIPGELYTVNPIAVNSHYADVFTQNKREVTYIDSPLLGTVAFVAVGATMVGSIRWSRGVGDHLRKGDELGKFLFGGSTCILLLPSTARIAWDPDLLANGRKSLESLVRVGERIGALAGSGAEADSEAAAAEYRRANESTAGVEPLPEK